MWLDSNLFLFINVILIQREKERAVMRMQNKGMRNVTGMKLAALHPPLAKTSLTLRTSRTGSCRDFKVKTEIVQVVFAPEARAQLRLMWNVSLAEARDKNETVTGETELVVEALK